MKKIMPIVGASVVVLLILVLMLPDPVPTPIAKLNSLLPPIPVSKSTEQIKREVFEGIASFYAFKIANAKVLKNLKPRFASNAHFDTNKDEFQDINWNDSVCEYQRYNSNQS